MFAIETVLIEIDRWAIGRCDQGYARFDQTGKQPRHDHRIGAVVHHHFIKGKEAGFVRQCRHNRQDRISLFLLALFIEPGMHIQHELMKMRTFLAVDLQTVIKQIHQHRLAAPNPAPHIDAARRFRLFREHPPQHAATRWHRFKFFLQLGQTLRTRILILVRLQFPIRDQRLIARVKARHCGAFFTIAV